jgi:hypothetical protein
VKKDFAIFGILTILFWLSLSVWLFIYPIDIWMQYEPASFWLTTGLILAGVVSGVLLLVHPRSGRVLAMVLCTVVLAYRAWSLARSYPHISDRLHGIFFLLLPTNPVYVIHSEIITLAFYITTIVFLWRKQVD